MNNTNCPKCGSIISQGKRFCTSCGTQAPQSLPSTIPTVQGPIRQAYSQSGQGHLPSGHIPAQRSALSKFQSTGNGALSEENIYLKKTYSYFLLAMISICAIGYISFNFVPRQHWATLGALDCLIWILCGWFGWRHPIIITFPSFTIITGLFLGALANQFNSSGNTAVFVNAAILTIMAFVGLTIYVFVTRKDFYWLLGFLIAGFWILLGSFYVYMVTGSTLLNLGIDIFGIIVFTGWILFDTSRMLNRRDSDLTPPIAAFELFLDIIGLHSYILDLFDLDWRDWFK